VDSWDQSSLLKPVKGSELGSPMLPKDARSSPRAPTMDLRTLEPTSDTAKLGTTTEESQQEDSPEDAWEESDSHLILSQLSQRD